MKEFWVNLDSLEGKILDLAGIIAKADVVLSQRLSKKEIEELAGIKAKVASLSEDSDIQMVLDATSLSKKLAKQKPTATVVEIRSGRDETAVAEALDRGSDFVIIKCLDWKIIPLENVISKKRSKGKVLMEVSNHSQARIALETLELGSDGVVLNTTSPEEVSRTSQALQSNETVLSLVLAEVTGKKEMNLGSRVCVDTTDLMNSGEGLLVGCQSNGYLLVQAEVEDNPYIPSRPFRVNAGSISSYVLSSPNKTNYLSELEAGHPVLIVDREGKTRPSHVGRVKIERRPLVLVETLWQGKKIKTILQNAETIRLVSKDGSISVAELKSGDLVLAYIQPGGRHFGTLVAEESIIER